MRSTGPIVTATGDASYTIINGVVYLSGPAGQSPPNGKAEFAVLPLAARPTHTLYLTTNAEGLPYSILRINPNGAMYLFSAGNGGDPTTLTTLRGLSYHLGS